MTSNFKYSDFKPVVRKKRKNKNQEPPSLATLLERAREELAKDGWNAQCQQLLQVHLTENSVSPSQILCLGLGSPSASSNSRAQLAFLLEICQSLGIQHAKVSVYDPVFSAEDAILFEQLGIPVLAENRASAIAQSHPLKVPTILWMPHCDLDLYENVLAANWTLEQLSNLILISNRLGDYADSNPRQRLETRAPCLSRIHEMLRCHLLPVSVACPAAFTAIAIQSVPYNANLPGSWFPAEIVVQTAESDES